MKTIKTLFSNRIFWLIIGLILLVLWFITLYSFSEESIGIISLFIEASFVISCWLFSKKFGMKWLLYIIIYCISVLIYIYFIEELLAIESTVLSILGVICFYLTIPAGGIILIKLVQKKSLSK